MSTSIALTATTRRFHTFAVAVLAAPAGTYTAAQVSKSQALMDAFNAGDSITFKSLILAW